MGAEKQEERGAAAAGVAGRAPAREKSSFAVTCSLLSQYLKEKKGGLQGLGGLGMAPPPAAPAGAFRPPTTMNLLSALDAPPAAEEPNDAAKATSEEAEGHGQPAAENPREAAAGEDEAQQLTIFYGGKVVVFDKFPSAKVKDLLQIVSAGGGGGGGDRAGATAAPQASQNSLSADMPIARRNSLHRFLEKRKGRITAKAPYQVSSAVGADASKQATGDKNSWLGLGQELTVVKQEI
ncbi:protein TIFY 10A [Panicum miliaceum]|uniref:Protein TIFY n=1 Tax=Panicum miliaceum TaxID=4540 RepID=A0A3L6T4E5_PANMI|nr:protein TIFY 10A [Panicum miliaceum]